MAVDKRGIVQQWPEHLIPIEDFGHLVESEKKAIQEHERWSDRADDQAVAALSDIAGDKLKAIHDAVCNFENLLHKLSTLPHTWGGEALRDIAGGSSLTWRERHRATQMAIDTIEPLIFVADNRAIEFPDGIDNQTALGERSRTEEVRGWRWTTKLVDETISTQAITQHHHVLKGVTMNGRRCTSLEQFSVLIDVLTVRHECQKAWRVWTGHHDGTSVSMLCNCRNSDSYTKRSVKPYRLRHFSITAAPPSESTHHFSSRDG